MVYLMSKKLIASLLTTVQRIYRPCAITRFSFYAQNWAHHALYKAYIFLLMRLATVYRGGLTINYHELYLYVLVKLCVRYALTFIKLCCSNNNKKLTLRSICIYQGLVC